MFNIKIYKKHILCLSKQLLYVLIKQIRKGLEWNRKHTVLKFIEKKNWYITPDNVIKILVTVHQFHTISILILHWISNNSYLTYNLLICTFHSDLWKPLSNDFIDLRYLTFDIFHLMFFTCRYLPTQHSVHQLPGLPREILLSGELQPTWALQPLFILPWGFTRTCQLPQWHIHHG